MLQIVFLSILLTAGIAGSPAFGQDDGALWRSSAGTERFRLMDKDDEKILFGKEASKAEEADYELLLMELESFQYSQQRWNETRKAIETGTLPAEGPEEAPKVEPVSAEAPPAATELSPELEVPSYGTSLSVTGRKTISFNFNGKRFLNNQQNITRPQSTNFFDIQQQLQIRMQGKVGEKISVNVDYDDTKPNKQDISISYKGEADEVVQNASFGDIDLSLPATEFVSYNKQLFGVRVDLKFKKASFTLVGSRTKGITKTKQFIGNTQLQSKDILDTSYIRRKFYDLSFGTATRLPILPGSEIVLMDVQSVGRTNVDVSSLTINDEGESAVRYTGNFVQLKPGSDYIIDYVRGVITFKNTLLQQAVVAVNYTEADGKRLISSTETVSGRLIKTPNDLPISEGGVSTTTQKGFTRELKTFYSIGATSIVRDDGRGSFILQVLDRNRQEVGASLSPPQAYPSTIEVDFENGTFQLKNPFAEAEIYAPTPIGQRIIFVEFRNRFKTFFLEPSLVLQSESVLLDGQVLRRNVDYFIDYDIGIITFFNEDQIKFDSKIDVAYEVSPFGPSATNSILGARGSFDITRWWSIGATMLYDAASKPPTTPSVQQLPRSLFVYEMDTQLKDIRLLPFLTGTFKGEIAQSGKNPNLSNFALLDNMEGIKQDDSASPDKNFWLITANPSLKPTDHPGALKWDNEDVKVREINAQAGSSSEEVQKVLRIDYDFAVGQGTEVSLVYVYSEVGLDFTKKSFLELVVFGDNSNNKINLHLGAVNEDADGDGVLDTEDFNVDAILQSSEDIGWTFNPRTQRAPFPQQGAGNGRIDAEDLNRNGRLDAEDLSGGDFGYRGGAADSQIFFDATTTSSRTAVDFSGWHTLQVPLGINDQSRNNWAAIHQLRFSITRSTSGAASGALRIARISVVGSAWQNARFENVASGAPSPSGELQVGSINNVDNSAYLPIFRDVGEARGVFDDLYGSQQLPTQANNQNRVEQALALSLRNLAAGTTIFTKQDFSKAVDLSQHREFRFLLYSNPSINPGPALGGAQTFFLRLGNEQNYYEFRVPVKSDFNGWRLFTAALQDLNGDNIPDTWKNASAYEAVTLSFGNPSFQNVSSVFAGIYNTGNVAISTGTLWLDELHVADPRRITGNARKLSADFTVPSWMTFGGSHRFVDRNFQTPVTVVANQDNQQDQAFLNFNRLSFFPMRFNLTRQITETPSVALTGDQSNLVSLLSQGKLVRLDRSGTGALTLWKLPSVNMSASRNTVDYQSSTRYDDRRSYSASTAYGLPWQVFFLPRNVNLSYELIDSRVNFRSVDALRLPGNANTKEILDNLSASGSFEFWRGAKFNPTYSLARARESREEFSTGQLVQLSYPKSKSQTAGFNSTLHLTDWLSPSIDYKISHSENNLLNVSTVTIGDQNFRFGIGDIKSVKRNADGTINLPFSLRDIWTRTKLFQSFTLTSSYQISDGDSWENVEREFESLTNLWVRNRLTPSNPVARRTTLTLRDSITSSQRWSPFQAYDLQSRREPLKTITLSNNFSRSLERRDNTGTLTRTLSLNFPDLTASMTQMENLLGAEKWMKNAGTNFKFARRLTVNVGLDKNTDTSFGADFRFKAIDRFDTATSFNQKLTVSEDLRIAQVTQRTTHRDASAQTTFDARIWRFTTKLDYTFDLSTLGTGQQTTNVTTLTPSVLARADLSVPKGFLIPFSEKKLVFSNRIVWSNTLSLSHRRSPLSQSDNSDLLSLDMSGDYEISKNLRLTLNAGLSRLWHKFLKQEEFVAYNIGSTLTFQF